MTGQTILLNVVACAGSGALLFSLYLLSRSAFRGGRRQPRLAYAVAVWGSVVALFVVLTGVLCYLGTVPDWAAWPIAALVISLAVLGELWLRRKPAVPAGDDRTEAS
jgi:hypothetical protein